MASLKLHQVELEILKIFEDCKAQGLSKDEICEIFAPLVPRRKLAKNLSNIDIKSINGNRGTFANIFCNMKLIAKKVRRFLQYKNLLKFLVLSITLFVVGSLIAKNEEKIKTIRFHALAIIRIALVKILPYWNWTDLYYSRCLVRNPFFETPNLNPDDCNLCESLEELTRVQNISQGRAIEEFIRRERPFIVTDAMDDWDVMITDQLWFDNITELYLKHPNHRVCNVNTNLRISNGDFTRVLKRLYNPRTQEWFIHWENCQKEMAKGVRQYYRRPYFISNSLDFTGSNWVLMSSDFKGRVYKKIEGTDSLLMLYQIRGFNQIRISPRDTCRGHCPELVGTLNEGEILVVTNLLWILEYIPGEFGDNLAILSEVSWPME